MTYFLKAWVFSVCIFTACNVFAKPKPDPNPKAEYFEENLSPCDQMGLWEYIRERVYKFSTSETPYLLDRPLSYLNETRTLIAIAQDTSKAKEDRDLAVAFLVFAYWRIVYSDRLRLIIGFETMGKEELFSLANLSVLKAIPGFDLEKTYVPREGGSPRNYRFTSYLFQVMRKELYNEIALKLSVSVNELREICALTAVRLQLRIELKRIATLEEVAQKLNWSIEKTKTRADLYEEVQKFLGQNSDSIEYQAIRAYVLQKKNATDSEPLNLEDELRQMAQSDKVFEQENRQNGMGKTITAKDVFLFKLDHIRATHKDIAKNFDLSEGQARGLIKFIKQELEMTRPIKK